MGIFFICYQRGKKHSIFIHSLVPLCLANGWIQIFQELIEAREKQQILRLRKALIEAEDVQLPKIAWRWHEEMRWDVGNGPGRSNKKYIIILGWDSVVFLFFVFGLAATQYLFIGDMCLSEKIRQASSLRFWNEEVAAAETWTKKDSRKQIKDTVNKNRYIE